MKEYIFKAPTNVFYMDFNLFSYVSYTISVRLLPCSVCICLCSGEQLCDAVIMTMA